MVGTYQFIFTVLNQVVFVLSIYLGILSAFFFIFRTLFFNVRVRKGETPPKKIRFYHTESSFKYYHLLGAEILMALIAFVFGPDLVIAIGTGIIAGWFIAQVLFAIWARTGLINIEPLTPSFEKPIPFREPKHCLTPA